MSPKTTSRLSVKDTDSDKREVRVPLRMTKESEEEKNPSSSDAVEYDIPIFEIGDISEAPLSRLLEIPEPKHDGDKSAARPASVRKSGSLSGKSPPLHFQEPRFSPDALTFDIPDFVLSTSRHPLEDAELETEIPTLPKTSPESTTSLLAREVEPHILLHHSMQNQHERAYAGSPLTGLPQTCSPVNTSLGQIPSDEHRRRQVLVDHRDMEESQWVRESMSNVEACGRDLSSFERPKRNRSQRVIQFDGLECSLESTPPELTSDESRLNRSHRRQIRRRQRRKNAHVLYSGAQASVAERVTLSMVPPTFDAVSNERLSEGLDMTMLGDEEFLDGLDENKKTQRAVKNRAAALKSRRNAKEKMSQLEHINADLRRTIDRLFYMNGALHAEMGHLHNVAGIPPYDPGVSVTSHLSSLGRAHSGGEPLHSPTAPDQAAVTSQHEKTTKKGMEKEQTLYSGCAQTRNSTAAGTSVEINLESQSDDLF